MKYLFQLFRLFCLLTNTPGMGIWSGASIWHKNRFVCFCDILLYACFYNCNYKCKYVRLTAFVFLVITLYISMSTYLYVRVSLKKIRKRLVERERLSIWRQGCTSKFIQVLRYLRLFGQLAGGGLLTVHCSSRCSHTPATYCLFILALIYKLQPPFISGILYISYTWESW